MSDLPKSTVASRLYEALITSLHTTDFAEISVNELCKQAGLSRSTFYFYYADKLAVLEALVQLYATQFDELMATLSDPDVDAFLKALYTGLCGDADAVKTLLDVHEPSADLGHEYREVLRKRAAKLLPQVQLSVPAEFAKELYATNAFTAIDWALRHGEPEAIAKFMNSLAQNVIATK